MLVRFCVGKPSAVTFDIGVFQMRPPSISRLRNLPLRFCAGLGLIALGACTESDQGEMGPQAFLGVPAPGGLELPPQLSVLLDAGFTAPPAKVPPGEEGFTELEGEVIRELAREIVAFSHESRDSGLRMWGRVSGFPAAVATADWVADRYREAGLQRVEVQRYEPDADMWWPDEWEVRLLGNPDLEGGSEDVTLHSAVPARGTEIAGGTLTAPVVFVGDVGDFSDVDVTGKIAVQRRKPTSGAASQRTPIREGAAELFDRGAVAVLNYVDQPGNMHVRDFSGCAHCFNIGGADGAFITAVAERAAAEGHADDVRVRLTLDASMRSGLTAQNVVGIVPGDSDEVVVVNAHLDGWYGASGDNADGLAVQIAMARHFAKAENRQPRTLVFVASGGHHSTGLNGPQNFVSMNPELAGGAVLVLNLEHPAQYLVDPGSFEVQRAEQPLGWGITNLAPFLIELTDRGVERYGMRLRPEYSTGVPGDLGRYAPLGIPRVQGIHAAPLYHTTGDVFESISVEGLERAARFHTFFVKGVAAASREQIQP